MGSAKYFLFILCCVGTIFTLILAIMSFINIEALKIKKGRNIKSGANLIVTSALFACLSVFLYFTIRKNKGKLIGNDNSNKKFILINDALNNASNTSNKNKVKKKLTNSSEGSTSNMISLGNNFLNEKANTFKNKNSSKENLKSSKDKKEMLINSYLDKNICTNNTQFNDINNNKDVNIFGLFTTDLDKDNKKDIIYPDIE